jgi:hypothetical protein
MLLRRPFEASVAVGEKSAKPEELMKKNTILVALILLPVLALASQRVMVNEEFTRTS